MNIGKGLIMYELARALQSLFMALLSLFMLQYIGFFASLSCLILAGAYAFLAIRGANNE